MIQAKLLRVIAVHVVMEEKRIQVVGPQISREIRLPKLNLTLSQAQDPQLAVTITLIWKSVLQRLTQILAQRQQR